MMVLGRIQFMRETAVMKAICIHPFGGPEVLPKVEMKTATIVARNLLGLIFVTFGSNIFLNFIPMPPPPEGPAREFMTALVISHYLYVVGALQVVGGLILIGGRWIPLGLTLLGPVIVNIVCFHVLMAPAGLPMALVVSFLALFLLWRYREPFMGLVKNAGPALSQFSRQAVATGNAPVKS
jgi:putative oxidoreductase